MTGRVLSPQQLIDSLPKPNFHELIHKETTPKHKTFFGKAFDIVNVAQKFSIHTVPQYKLFCGIEEQDEKGVYIPELSRVWEGHSLLANWYNQLRSVTFAVDGNDGTSWADGYINYKTVAGTVVSQNYPIVWTVANGYIIASAGGSTSGLVLGITATAVTERDNALASIASQGNTAGHLNYGNTVGNITYDSTTKTWQEDIGRPVTGNAVDSVTVAEMGLTLAVYNGNYILTARDLVSPTKTVGIAEAVTFHYILQQINPA